MSSEIIVQIDQSLPNDPGLLKNALLKNREILGARLNEKALKVEHIKGDKWKIIFANNERRGIEFLLLKSKGFQVVNQD